MGSGLDYVRYLCNFCYFFVTNVYGFFAYVMWMTVLLPLRFTIPDVYWAIEEYIFKGLITFVVMWTMTSKYGGR